MHSIHTIKMVTYYNRIDEKGRFMGLKTDPKGTGQYDTHTFSYLYCREIEKAMTHNEPIGLEVRIHNK